MNSCLRSLVLIFIISACLSPAVMAAGASSDKPRYSHSGRYRR